MTDELPGGGTSQLSGASQAAAEAGASGQPAASRPEAAVLYEAADTATQQQASRDEAPASENPRAGEAEAGKSPEHAEASPKDDSARQDNAPESSGPEGAPEHYDFTPVAGVQLAEEVLGSFSEVARELNLTQDAAQKMLDRVAPVIARQQQAAMQAVSAQWVSEARADKEIGGDRLQQNLAIAKRARDAFGTDGLRRLLNESRIGNHPEMIRFFVRAGQAISEDSFVPGGTRPPAGGKDAATVLYGKHN